MRTLYSLMADLRKKSVTLGIANGRLQFDAPKGMLLQEDLEEIRAHKAAIMDLLRHVDQGQALRLTRRAAPDRPSPLSLAQRRMWFIDQLQSSPAAYHISTAVRLRGELHLPALEAMLEALMRRHEVLRTVFATIEGQPMQIVRASCDFELRQRDLSRLNPADREAMARRQVEEEAEARFDLERGPLIRGCLLKLSEQEHVLVMTLHHIIADGWSMGVLIREMEILYQAFRDGRANPLADLPIQYADYAEWQQQWLVGKVLQEHLNYWQWHLAGAPALLQLPTDRVRPALQGQRGDNVGIFLGKELSAALKELARRLDVTLYMVLYAGFAILLSRLSGQKDIVIGTPVANRQRTELEGLIGFFVNTLALRVTLDTEATVGDLLRQVKELTLAGYAHQEVPFEQVVEVLQPPRSLSHSPVFQVMFSLQNTPRSTPQLAGLKLERQAIENRTAQFDLVLSLQEDPEGIAGGLNYSSDLFERATIERWIGYFKTVLSSMAQDALQEVAALPLLNDVQRQQVLREFNTTDVAYAPEVLIHELFEMQVERTPAATAVIHAEQRLDYAQLNRRANQLAHYLRDRGVGPDRRVALYMERGIEMVIGVLATLKAGGAYVPLDPSYPPERILYLLSDAAPCAVLTQGRLKSRLPQIEVPVIAIDDDGAQLEHCRDDNISRTALGLTSRHLAYVIYTSGSTGVPKGVMLEHRNVTNYLRWAIENYRVGNVDAALVSSSLAFDATVTSLYTPLLCGRMVRLIAQGDEIDGLERCLRDSRGPNLIKISPAHLAALGQRLATQRTFDAENTFVIGGEALPAATVELWQRVNPKARLINEYGPTETTVGCSIYEVPPEWGGGPVPIGRPIANTQIYILDSRRQPVPIGVVGEIHIGGAGVARGYLNQAELSAERFVLDPVTSGRIYKSGDLGRWRTDGTIEYIGRNDQQVKIRGYRIELGEIEAQLGRHPHVQEAVVMTRGDAGDQRLIAYATTRASALNAEVLRAYLGERLPQYMIPSAFVLLESMPLTTNGKVDRQALPAPALDAYATHEYEAPQGPIEIALTQIWQELLHVVRVGRHDNFFDLGGHSLLALQLIARVVQVLDRQLTLRQLFDCPTVQLLARQIAAASAGNLGTIERADRNQPLALSLAQQRLWFIDRLAEAGRAYHIASAIRLRGDLHVEALQATLDALVQRHEALRTVFTTLDGQPVQVISAAGNFALQRIDLTMLESSAREAEVRRQVEEEAGTRFDLSAGPLIRGRLLAVAEQEHVLLVTMHHIVADGWSMGVLVREISILYAAHREGRAAELPALSIQYADYAQWQRQWLVGEILQRQLHYWKETLTDAPALLELPTDHARPAVQGYRGEHAGVWLGNRLSKDLRGLARRFDATLYMVLYAGFAILLSRLSGQRDIVIGTPVANRQRTELEGLIGFFVNTLALRTTMNATASVGDVLRQVKELTLAGFAHQEVPFEQIVEMLQPPRNLSHSPVFQVMFSLQNTPGSDLQLPGLTWTPQGVSTHTAQFDLSLLLQEADEGVFGTLNYSSDLFERATIERWIGYFKTVLSGMAQDAQQQVAGLQLLSEAERRQVLLEFNATQVPYPRDASIQALFEAQAACAPDAVAVVCQDERLSYAQLNRRANRLARYLIQCGVQAGEYVPLVLPRSVDMVVAQLAVLKSGCAYVPIDPEFPLERQRFMIRDCQASAVIAESRDALSGLQSIRWIELQAAAEEIESMDSANLLTVANGSTIAYVMYTSGSTGEPKGVVVEHRAVNRLVINNGYADIEADDCICHCSNPAFDASTFEIWGALLNGARVLILPQSTALESKEFGAALTEGSVSILFLTTALFNQHVKAVPHALAGLRYLLFGGEVCDPGIVREFLQDGGPRHLLHVYGPTENTTFSSWYRVDSPAASAQTIPIGRPLSNTQIYLLDERLEPVPIGVTGEIYIGGAGVARGYLHRPELTAQRFLTDPFSTDPQARIYKSGDLGRWRADGTIEYLGRNDHQVKVRGYRIELGEIEAQLRRAESVTDAVVIAREDVSGQKRLIAYVTSTDSGFSAEAMRTHLSERLPPYMLPSAFVRLDRLPLTPNGKVDHKALPAPELDAYATREYEAPQGEIEVAIAEIWQSLLQVERIGRHDHFFELGGHSLLIVQLIERLRQHSLQAEVRSVFDAPTVAGLASRVSREGTRAFQAPPNRIPPDCEQITPAMLPLIELTEAEIEQVVAQVPGGAKNIQDLYPLAPLQEGILFHHLLTEANNTGDTYVLPMLLQVADRLHVEKLIDALQALIDRHDILRTAVLWEALPRAVQVVYRRAPLPVEELVLSGQAPVLTQMQQRMTPGQQRLELRRAPLMQLKLAHDGEHDRWYVLLQLHHLTSDHVALELVVSEVDAHLQGRGSQLAEPLPYRHYVAQALARAQRNDAEAFFRRKLGSVEEPTAPFGLIDVHGDGSEVLHVHEQLDAALAHQVRTLARRLGMSPASLFHAAFGLVVARTSAREDIVFGSVLSGRLQGTAGADRMLGMFINTLPLRLQLQGMTALQWVQQTHRELVALLEHEQASLAMAQRCSGIGGGAPLFSSIFNYRHSAAPAATPPSQTRPGIGVIAVQERTNYPLSVSVDDLGEGFGVKVQADQRIDAQRVSHYLCTALAGLMQALESAPTAQALHLPVLPKAERRQVLEEFNATRVAYPQSALIHELFEAQVERTPTAIAVVYEGERLNYAQLNARANQLARYLLTYGITPDQRVAICVERSLEMIVGLLGILKAGGAYVPLDPKYPAERLQYMLSDAAPCLVLTQHHLKDTLPTTTAAVITLDSDWPQIAQHSEVNVPAAALALTAKHLAYVIYTSGSTGLPKGVMIEHAGLCNLVATQAEVLNVRVHDRVLQFASLSFDACAWEWAMALCSGASLHLAAAETLIPGEALLSVLRDQKITHTLLPPTALAACIASEPLEDLSTLIAGGEACPASLARHWSKGRRFINAYGPTEGTVCVSMHIGCAEGESTLPIGRPISNTQIYLLDEHLEPVPIGVTGEIYIGGAGVARGYLHRPALTAQRFLTDPFSTDPQARIYKSGDLGRWRADGTIEYLGRNDHQVKVRGYRIELGEIEAQLRRAAQVKDAVVIAREDVSGQKRLIAYATSTDSGFSAESLRTHLSERLPPYMLPSAFVRLDTLPLTPNGKVDHKALPAPELDAYATREYEAPQGEIEVAIAEIWQSLLQVERIGRHDDFFELGGQSLLVMQAMARINQALGRKLPLRDLFDYTTVQTLAQRLNAASGMTLTPIGLADRDRPLLLSLAQQRLWFIDRLEGVRAAYHIRAGVRLLGELNVPALQAALDTIIERHEVLRAVFTTIDGQPVQRITEASGFALQQVDLSAWSAAEREAEALRHAEEEATSHFDLSRGPLIRGRLLMLAEQEHALLLTMHHIVADGWSMGILIREVSALYAAYRDGRSNPLPPLPIQYVDYAQWQRRWLVDEILQKQLSYWKEHLTGAPALLELPTDRARPAMQSYRGGSVGLRLGRQLSSDLKALAKRFDATLYMTLYAGFAVLLSRLGGQGDIVIGVPVANRQRTEMEGLIGLFLNTLAMRVRVDVQMSVAELLKQVKELTLAGFAHQDVPFEQVVEELQPPRTLSHTPVFQVMLSLQNTPGSALQLPGLTPGFQAMPNHTAPFDLSLSLQETGGEIVGGMHYASDLFERSTIERWLGYFQAVLKGMVQEAQQPIGALRLSGDAERRQVLMDFNATQVAYPQSALIHELFEAQVERTPTAIALVYEGERLNYAQLNARANQLARHLLTYGLTPDQRVAICVERGLEMIVGLLGILKAGGAYVPLDPKYPAERLQYMLSDAAPCLVLTQQHLKDSLPTTTAPVITVDGDWPQIAQHSEANLPAAALELTAKHLAYVIYTSGSTGLPKGVMIEHAGLCNLVATQAEVLNVRVHDRVLQFASLSFDACTWEWAMALCSGASLHLAAAETLIPGEALLSVLRDQKITHTLLPPTALAACIASEPLEDLSTLIAGGEACPASLARHWSKGRRFINAYGPTEGTVCVSMHIGGAEGESTLPIGRPISNTQIYLLDERLEPVPIGVTGEIYIGGAGVARGYLHRPELTAQRFLTDPFSTDPQARIYKSGDLGRWRADGTIEYLGRNDHQVKVRGYRIELGEIEAQLRRAAQVKDAVVIAREDVSGQKRLIAYVTSTDSNFSAEAMRTHLSERLPPYMLPSAFVRLDTLPLTPNGKVDHKALPAPELDAYATREYQAPQGEIEVTIAEIWQSLLQVERVGRHDHFFELGGHSLLIVQLIERLRHYSLQAEVRSVFDAPTVAGLASRVSREGAQAFQAPPNRIPPDCEQITPAMLPLIELTEAEIEQIVAQVPGGAKNIQDLYPLAPLQEGILFHHLLTEANNTGDTYVLPMLLQVADRLHVEKLIDALQALIDRHDILRTAVLWEALPRAVQVVYRRAPLPVEELVLSGEAPVLTQMQQRMTPGQQRLELRRAPLMQLKLAHDGEQDRWYVLLQLHHLTSDHVALELVVSEVDAHLQGRGSQLAEPLPYRHYVAQALARAQRNDAETFFRSKLGSMEEPTAPFGLIDVHGDGSEVLHVHERLDAALARQVRALARRLGMSPASLFHAAFGLVVARTSAREDIVFGSVLSGRLQGTAGADRMLGMFINTLPLRLQLQGMTALQWVQQTHRELVALLEHEQASLAMAQRCSGIGGGAPLFSSIFNYRHSAAPSTAEPSHKSQGIGVIAVQERTNYPLSVSVDDLGEGFGVTVQADQRIDAQRMSRYLCTALAGLMQALESAPATQALHLPVLPEAERRQVLEEFNATRVAYPQSALIHELFEAQVERTPTAIALVYEGERLNYAQLNARANQLARYLLTYGITPDQRVAICVERGLEMIVGLLGILKAGGAYVPLDPKYPAERLQYMLSDAAPCLVLAQQHLKDNLPTTTAPVITLDSDWPQIARRSEANLTAATLELTSKHLAYVIYTSGSTGLPKGVMVEHANVTRLFAATQQWFHFDEHDVWSVFHSFSFDFSVWELWGALLYGGRAVVVSETTARSPQAFYRLLCEAGVTVLNQTPTAFTQLIEAQQDAENLEHSLRLVIFGGEALKVQALQPWVARNGVQRPQLVNMYGITETTVHVTRQVLTLEQIESGDSAIVGRPIEDLHVYILDAQLQPVPIGVPGEIYVGGAGVARGYLNRQNLTAQRFIADPFDADSRARLYKSGDLGCWRADGTIEHLGRNDRQVKIRGYRIELGEIEARLSRHERLREVVVMVREDVPDQKQLVAYATCTGNPPTAEELRAHLNETLPPHMVPGAFVLLESWPLTANGKLDRGRLPAPGIDSLRTGRYVAPRNEVEAALCGIWRETLHLDQVGVDDNFFDLGGHSIHVTQIVRRIERDLRLTVPLVALFRYPTIAAMTQYLASDVARPTDRSEAIDKGRERRIRMRKARAATD